MIKLIMQRLLASGFHCQQAEEDADRLIVITAKTVALSAKISAPSKKTNVVIVGQDIDLLVLLCQLAPEHSSIFFNKVGTKSVKESFYSSDSFKHDRKLVAFLHSFTGCDTTSGFSGKGKKTAIKSLLCHPNLATLAEIFYDSKENINENEDEDESEKERKKLEFRDVIAKNGCNLIASMYSNKKGRIQPLNDVRYLNYTSKTFKSGFKLEKLPPTEGAAIEHSFRVYFQIQKWHGVEKSAIEWGWKYDADKNLIPKFTADKLIPEDLLKKICCSCETGCEKKDVVVESMDSNVQIYVQSVILKPAKISKKKPKLFQISAILSTFTVHTIW